MHKIDKTLKNTFFSLIKGVKRKENRGKWFINSARYMNDHLDSLVSNLSDNYFKSVNIVKIRKM